MTDRLADDIRAKLTALASAPKTHVAIVEFSREYLESTIAKARSAIAFASPAADLSYAKAVLLFAQIKLDTMNAAQKPVLARAD